MVEHTVKDDLDALCVAFLYEICKVCVVAQTAVELLVIGGLVAVSDRLEQRPDIDRIAADLFDVSDPGENLV